MMGPGMSIEERVRVLELSSITTASEIKLLREGEIRVLAQKLEHFSNVVAELRAVIARIGWIIGGGFTTSIVVWIIGGGLSGG